MPLPPDSHVHSEWSWDAPLGDMEQTCARAVALGLPAIAFTEHLDHTVWRVPATAEPRLTALAAPDGMLTPPSFDPAGYFDAIDRCRSRFPGLRILTGVEMGEPHWHAPACAKVLAAGRFERVLGSLHCLPDADGYSEPWALYDHRDADDVIRSYLAGVADMVATSDMFEVLAHIDYPVRSWPGVFDPADFEDEFRHALRATASSGRALELNTRIPLHTTILTWWHEEGGEAITFGSDAHLPELVGHGFREAAAMAEAHGFRPGRNLLDLWSRAN
ncbi:PHP domain-containing protein [Actinoplanes sp. CA-142083]|uniref:PHP domain-containing protein n=1 Tax=Actinoplanes sp. CA-142083 TaxID=3239903 RepID=UPI003D9072A7